MLLRILILALLFWLALEVFFRGLRFFLRRVVETSQIPRQPPSDTVMSVEGKLVRCSQCGVRVPQDRAWPGADGVFCSEACRNAAPSGTA